MPSETIHEKEKPILREPAKAVALEKVKTKQSIKASIILVGMKARKTQETKGDELYFHLHIYPSYKEHYSLRIPEVPKIWRSQKLKEVTNVPIFEESIPEGGTVNVVISLMEKDDPPFDSDDLLGVITAHFKNDQGKLKSLWSIPNRTDAPVLVTTKLGPSYYFDFFSKHFRYELYFLRQ